LVRYSVAVLVVVAALAVLGFVKQTIPALSAGLGTLLFFAVFLSAWFGGLGPGLLSTALVALLGLAQVAKAYQTGTSDVVQVVVRVALFATGGSLISSLVEALHLARRRAEASAAEAQRHRATLRQNEALVQAMLENSPAVVYVKDTAGHYLMVNRRFATLFSIEEAAVVGKTDFDLFPAATAEQFTGNDRRVIESGKPVECEERVDQSDGEHIYLSVKFPLFSEGGEIAAVCGKSTDITDRKRAEEYRLRLSHQAALRADVSMALARNHSELTTILEDCAAAGKRHLDVAAVGIWTLDDSGETLVLQASAGDAADRERLERRIAVGRTLIGDIARDRRPRWTNELDKPEQADYQDGWAQDGVVAFAGYPLLVEDRLLGVMALCAREPVEDDTFEGLAALAEVIAQGIERLRLERERIDLLARERVARTDAEAANRVKDQFLAVLSHELRTPLTPILASVTALLAETETAPEVRSVLELTHWGIKLESRLIDDLLDMTRIMRGRIPLHLETADAHFLIERAVEICRAEIDGGSITLVVDLAAPEHRVHADPARLEQIFWNLIKNAVKFSPQGGTLTIRTRNTPGPAPDSGSAPHRTDLVVEFSDTGVGIEPELLPIIFDAFTQGEAGWVRRFGGLGLGLAISRSIVEAHGGRIAAASPGKDQGASFTVTLATVPTLARALTGPPAAASSASPAPTPAPPRNFKVLLVEDDGPTLKVMTRLLGRKPYSVKTANTFATALEAASREDFDLIISDIGLPDGSGLELMRQIRDRFAARGIALSGYGMDEDIRKSREAGFLAHLTKPVDFQKLQVAIAQVLS
jgi:PAS domain S-box-containing protein